MPISPSTRAALETGVYLILNTVTGDGYIGSTGDSFASRWASHKRDLRARRHHSKYLENAWWKYGEEVFRFVVLYRSPPEDCRDAEQWYLDDYWETKWCTYNIVKEATGWSVGVKRSDEIEAKRSAAIKAAWANPEIRAKMCASMKGSQKPIDAEARAKRSEAMKKVYAKPEVRTKKSEAAKKAWANPEIRARMVASRRAREARRQNKFVIENGVSVTSDTEYEAMITSLICG